jgi:drug/metabolite transporter (DMT)-like permease
VTAAGAILFMGDAPTWRKIVAITLAVAGVLVLHLGQGGAEDGDGPMWLGAALVFGAVCCEAAYTLLGKKAAERLDPLLVACLSAALSVPFFLPFALWQWGDFASERSNRARGRPSPGTERVPWRSAAGSGTRASPGRKVRSPRASWA